MHEISPLVKNMEIDEQRPSEIKSNAKSKPETHGCDIFTLVTEVETKKTADQGCVWRSLHTPALCLTAALLRRHMRQMWRTHRVAQKVSHYQIIKKNCF